MCEIGFERQRTNEAVQWNLLEEWMPKVKNLAKKLLSDRRFSKIECDTDAIALRPWPTSFRTSTRWPGGRG